VGAGVEQAVALGGLVEPQRRQGAAGRQRHPAVGVGGDEGDVGLVADREQPALGLAPRAVGGTALGGVAQPGHEELLAGVRARQRKVGGEGAGVGAPGLDLDAAAGERLERRLPAAARAP
jgi:hypothetical protein